MRASDLTAHAWPTTFETCRTQEGPKAQLAWGPRACECGQCVADAAAVMEPEGFQAEGLMCMLVRRAEDCFDTCSAGFVYVVVLLRGGTNLIGNLSQGCFQFTLKGLLLRTWCARLPEPKSVWL